MAPDISKYPYPILQTWEPKLVGGGLEMYLGYTGKCNREVVTDAILYTAEPAYTLPSA